MTETVIRAEGAVRLGGNEVRWAGTMHPPGQEPAQVTYRFTCPDPDVVAGAVPSPRPFLLAFLPAAMRAGHPVVVEGEVDQTTLSNLAEWQEAMACWHRGDLRPVPLRAEASPAPRVAAGRGAVAAFSGGVDSCFTAVCTKRTPLRAGVMVQGFDIHRDDHEVFASAFDRTRRILQPLGIAAHRLHTDVRKLEDRWPVDWETTSHGIWLASALACFDAWYDLAIIPSTFPYDRQILPWASNPLTDHLLGSEAVPVWHDGAAFDKLDKVCAIARVPSVAANLRVCWEGDRLDRNCGRCYKCVTTAACFWASGVPQPDCFDPMPTIDELSQIDFNDAYRLSLAEGIRAAALEIGRNDVASAIELALDR